MQQHTATITVTSRVNGGCADEFIAAVSFTNEAGVYAGERAFTGRLRGYEPDAINFRGIGCDGASEAELAAIAKALVSINQRPE